MSAPPARGSWEELAAAGLPVHSGEPVPEPAPWPEGTLAGAGLDPAMGDRLAAVVAAGRAPYLHGLVVVRGGRLVFEHYQPGEDESWGEPRGVVQFGPDTPHDLRSVTKSLVAVGYGIALAAGQVPEPDAPLLAQFPEYPDLAADPRRAGLTVAHALTMTLGLEWNESLPYSDPANSEVAMELAPDRYRYLLERPVAGPPGRRWTYCGGATALLGRLIARGTGHPLHQYAAEALFAPLGVARFEWMAGADGVASAASGLRLTPRDLARMGQLVLAGGVWQGRRVVPAEWLAELVRPRTSTGWGAEYGYHWYLDGAGPRRWVGGLGLGGQWLLVYPELDLVVALTAGGYADPEAHRMLAAVLTEVVLAGLPG